MSGSPKVGSDRIVAPVGYYVHHHGVGHATRFAHIAASCDFPVTPISELDLPGGVRLPSDVVPGANDPTAGGVLHWAPVGQAQLAQRGAVFGRWLAENEPRVVVVDVSVEAALLCRLFGVATVVMRQHGDRTDRAHEMAYRSASALLAPFPSTLEHHSTPTWVRDKTTYAGFIFQSRDRTDPAPQQSSLGVPDSDDVVILWGLGGGALDRSDIEAIARAAGPNQVWFAGTEPFDVRPLGVRSLGWVDDVPAILGNRPTVVGSAGNNVVADAAAAGCALVAVPQDRPFEEQIRHAESLDASQVAAVMGPGGKRNWRAALALARSRRSALAALASGESGAAAAAEVIGRFLR